MPTYDYECERCKKTFEAEQKISDPPLTLCTLTVRSGTCGGKVKRVIAGSTSFVLKGPGWFNNGGY